MEVNNLQVPFTEGDAEAWRGEATCPGPCSGWVCAGDPGPPSQPRCLPTQCHHLHFKKRATMGDLNMRGTVEGP